MWSFPCKLSQFGTNQSPADLEVGATPEETCLGPPAFQIHKHNPPWHQWRMAIDPATTGYILPSCYQTDSQTNIR